jgi:hypothetical protein
LQAESNAIQRELCDTYQEAAQRIIEVFEHAKEFQARASRILGYPPPGVSTLSKFDNAVERVLDRVTLLNFAGEQMWPPPQISMGVAYVASIQFPSHVAGINGPIGPGWETEEVRERFRAKHEEEQERQRAVYENLSKEQEGKPTPSLSITHNSGCV